MSSKSPNGIKAACRTFSVTSSASPPTKFSTFTSNVGMMVLHTSKSQHSVRDHIGIYSQISIYS